MLPKPHTYLVYLCLLFCLTIAGVHSVLAAEPIEVLKEQITVLDGDTIVITTLSSKYKIRLADIDAPEKYQPFGQTAKAYLEGLLSAPISYVLIPDEAIETYDRQVCSVYTSDHQDVSALMLRAGLAWWYEKYSDKPEYDVLEWEARKERLGLWEQETPLAPWLYRKGISYEVLSRYYIYRPVVPGQSNHEKRVK